MRFNEFFKRIPLPVKLMLIGLIPLLLLTYLSVQLVSEQGNKLDLLGGYINRIQQSSDIDQLSYEIQVERRYSFEYALKGALKNEMMRQRKFTDTALDVVRKRYSSSLKNFTDYTFLSEFDVFRQRIDSGDAGPQAIMHYYTTAVFRLNTMNIVAGGTNVYLKNVYPDLIGQKILAEIITYITIIRINIYNALYTKKHMSEILMGTLGSYDVYKTYERELRQKTSPKTLRAYDSLCKNTELNPTIDYMDKLFRTLEFDSTYSSEQWWEVSLNAVNKLRQFQAQLRDEVELAINKIYNEQLRARNRSIIVVILMIIIGVGVIFYTTRSITLMLLDLKKAAQHISEGGTNIQLQKFTNDVIGSLSDSILRIDRANRNLAEAAEIIGKGKFDISIEPRSREDVLGNAIIRMKNDLHRFTNEMKELEKRKDTFITMASHELKTPITSIKGYVQLLLKMVNDIDKKGEELSRPLLHSSLLTIDKQVSKMTRLISELLDLSKIETGQFELRIQKFNLNDLVAETIKDLQQTTSHHQISLQNGMEFDIRGDKDRIGQVITNLLTNAIKYSPRSDKIEVQIYPLGREEVAISIRDYGIGIEKSEQNKIFERFYRAEGEEEKTYPGFGIGLFIASEIVNRHRGHIKVDSEPGKGSLFTVVLPVN